MSWFKRKRTDQGHAPTVPYENGITRFFRGLRENFTTFRRELWWQYRRHTFPVINALAVIGGYVNARLLARIPLAHLDLVGIMASTWLLLPICWGIVGIMVMLEYSKTNSYDKRFLDDKGKDGWESIVAMMTPWLLFAVTTTVMFPAMMKPDMYLPLRHLAFGYVVLMPYVHCFVRAIFKANREYTKEWHQRFEKDPLRRLERVEAIEILLDNDNITETYERLGREMSQSYPVIERELVALQQKFKDVREKLHSIPRPDAHLINNLAKLERNALLPYLVEFMQTDTNVAEQHSDELQAFLRKIRADIDRIIQIHEEDCMRKLKTAGQYAGDLLEHLQPSVEKDHA